MESINSVVDLGTGVLTKSNIKELLDSKEIYINPLLEEDQIGEISIDLRVGTDFLMQNLGREPFLNVTENSFDVRSIQSHFTETRRKLGESFILHPQQPVLFSTLEYIKLPDNVYGALTLRSSYNRLGISLSSIVQPGYCGCLSIELVNNGNLPIKILSGARVIQMRLIKINDKSEYFNTQRKYTCQVRPLASKANEDSELNILKNLFI